MTQLSARPYAVHRLDPQPSTSMVDAPLSLVIAFVVVVIATVSMVLALVRRAYLESEPAEPARSKQRIVFVAFFSVGLWMALTAAVASSGILESVEQRPAPLMILVGIGFLFSFAIAFSGFGTYLIEHVPVAWLVGYQGFRLPLELVMHRAAEDGVMPIQMSYSGWNLDIATGATAIVVAWLLARGLAKSRTLWLWNILGTGLLANIVVVAILSLPTFAFWGPDQLNLWVTHAPFVWLPTVMVPLAVIGHLLLWRRLLRSK